MIESMTGYGRGEATKNGITFVVELRSVNNRFLEVSSRLPRTISARENEIKEIVRAKVQRGKINITATSQDDSESALPLTVDTATVKAVVKLLKQVKKAAGITEKIRLDHVLKFSEIFDSNAEAVQNDNEWTAFEAALKIALDGLKTMREKEAAELSKDLRMRVNGINERIGIIEESSKQRIPDERKRLQERIAQLVEDPKVINKDRLELEIAILSDKLDVTEECVRFRSHNKFFVEALDQKESAGRKLNFLIQEMNREANTIGSKCNDVNVAQHVVFIKEELERIREQIQNIE